MGAYIEMVGQAVRLVPLNSDDLHRIGEFTRENVAAQIAAWIERGPLEFGLYGCDDFHAVCGDVEIPWATEEAKEIWMGRKPRQMGYIDWQGQLPSLTPAELEVLGPRYPSPPLPREITTDFKLPPGVSHDVDHPGLDCPACKAIEERKAKTDASLLPSE